MTTLTLAQLAEFAQAAYSTLNQGDVGTELARKLKNGDAGFVEAQADQFALDQTVILQYNDDAPRAGGNNTSLSVTVFKDGAGNITLAIRGTLEAGDYAPTDSLITFGGAGYDQITALANWWRKVSSPAGTLVPQYRISPSNEGQTDALNVSTSGLTSAYLVRDSDAVATGQLSSALLGDEDHQLDVTGHSLGGHLAMSFGSLKLQLRSIERGPVALPIWQAIHDDLGNPPAHRLDKVLGVSIRTIYRWNALQEAPRCAALALFWMTRWGQSHVNADAVNDAALLQQYVEALRQENAELRVKVERIGRLASPGAANGPTFMGLPL